VVDNPLAFKMVFASSIFDFGRLWFPVATFHGVCMELYSWI
jgi:hypothetical protein